MKLPQLPAPVIASAQWSTEDGEAIIATIDEQAMIVPNDPGNRLRQAVAAWEAAGHTIAAADQRNTG